MRTQQWRQTGQDVISHQVTLRNSAERLDYSDCITDVAISLAALPATLRHGFHPNSGNPMRHVCDIGGRRIFCKTQLNQYVAENFLAAAI
jgi:hypothetical protein